MTKKRVENAFLNKEKEDAQEFVEIVAKVPKERKREIVGLINGFCLAASMFENKKTENDVA